MPLNEAETRYELIDPVLRGKGYKRPYIKLETKAPVEPVGFKGRSRPGAGRTDYLLCVEVPAGKAPLPAGILEAKSEDKDPIQECDLWALVSLPGGVFVGASAAVKTNLMFFTKGQKTTKIWYYDLNHVKIDKKSPMTLFHFGFGKNGKVLDEADLPAVLTEPWKEDENSTGKFPSYARLLPLRGTPEAESRYSWTVDFAARRQKAREEAQPHKEEAARCMAEVVSLKEKLKALKASAAKPEKLRELETKIYDYERAARESQAKAEAIEATVYDLKAVNPNAIVKLDTRTPEEVIQSIEDQGKIVADALKALRN